MTKSPNFFVIGVVKGGTTALHHYLNAHPEIYMSPIKETNFFSRKDIDSSKFSKAYAHDVNVDLEKYLASNMSQKIHIAHIEKEADYIKLFQNVKDEVAIGEVSNSYVLYENAPRLIFKSHPKAKLIVMLRNPVERAFSQYVMNLRLGKTLEKDFIKEIERDDHATHKGWGANHQYLFIGKYFEQISRYYKVFPKDQLLICWYREYKANANKVLEEIYGFLGVDKNFKVDASAQLNTASIPRFKRLNYYVNQVGIISWAKRKLPQSWRQPFKNMMYAASENEIPRMSEAQRDYLVNYYKEDILKLSKLVNKDLNHWLS